MKQQTAMQQLLAYVKHNGQSWRGISADMIEKEFLPLEKQQIVKVIEDYLSWHSNKGYVSHKHGDPKEYYLDTYENTNT